MDVVDGYHSIPLDEESQHLTTFTTEWGRYYHLRAPQGWKGSGDMFTRRYEDITANVTDKVKVVDDTLLYQPTIVIILPHLGLSHSPGTAWSSGEQKEVQICSTIS